MHSLYTSLSRNITASNDPQQLQHDSNDMLIKGAGMLGDGRRLGMNDDQILNAALQRSSQGELPNADLRRSTQASFTNAADNSILSELAKRGRR